MRKNLWPAAVIAVIGQVVAAVLARGIDGPMPVHFDLHGEPDNFMSPGSFWWAMTLLQLGILVLFWWIDSRGDTAGRAARANIGMATGTVTLLAVVSSWTFYIAGEVAPRLGWGTMLVALLLSGIAGFAVAVLVDVPEPQPKRTYSPRLIDASPQANVTWVGHARPATGVVWLAAAAVLVAFVPGVLLNSVVLILVAAGCALLMAATLWFTMVLDATGLRYRSALGVPSKRIAFADLEAVEAVDIAVGDYGGWGLRISNGLDGRRGLITRAGEGIRVTHSGGKVLEITCGDARGAAGAWQAMAQ